MPTPTDDTALAAPRPGGLVPTQGALLPQAGAVAGYAAAAMQEVRLAIEMALAYPRDEDTARGKIMKVCGRFAFAEKATYAFPRGNTTVSGPSIKLAEEMGKAWRNLRWGHAILEDTPDARTVRGFAWDLEANIKKEIDASFLKIVYRKKDGWIPADARDLLELTNLHGSKAARNAILSLLPWDLVQDAVAMCRETEHKAIQADPEEFKKRVIAQFSRQGVLAAELAAYLGFPLDQLRKEDDIEHLRGIYRRMTDERLSWQEIVAERAAELGLVAEGAVPTSAKGLRELIHQKAVAAAEKKKAKENPTLQSEGQR